MLKSLLKYFRPYIPTVSREQALEIARAECERNRWPWREGRVKINQSGKMWVVVPTGPLVMGQGTVHIYISVEDGTIVRATAVLY